MSVKLDFNCHTTFSRNYWPEKNSLVYKKAPCPEMLYLVTKGYETGENSRATAFPSGD